MIYIFQEITLIISGLVGEDQMRKTVRQATELEEIKNKISRR